MRLRNQLFLILMLFSMLLIALMAGYNSWSFDRGFSNFVVENETRRLLPVIDELADGYAAEQSWDWIQDDPKALQKMLRSGLREGPPRSRGEPGGRKDKRSRPNPILLDNDKQTILGSQNPNRKLVLLPIGVDEQVVGYLGIREPKGIPGEIEQVFSQQQKRSYVYAAIAMSILSILLANFIASRIVKPILKVNKAVENITAGEYQHRIDTRSRDEIGDLSRNINQMALTLEKNLNARQQWTAEISHELRTPVAVLQGELEAIQDGVNPSDEQAIASLHAESVRLSRLINDLHESSLSDLGALNYRMESIDFAELLRQRLQESKVLIAKRGLVVELHGSDLTMMLRADTQRLVQLVDNLLQNSLRYTEEGGSLDITLRKESDYVVLDWADSYPGVTDEQLPRLFDSLYRTDESRNRGSGGSGLGLAIVAKIVEAHNGEVMAYHSSSGGLGIAVRLPV